MKTFKNTVIVSGVIFFFLSVLCFISTISYDIDAYDFGNIYKVLNPAKVFLLFTVIIFIGILVIKYRSNNNINIEKWFAVLIVIIYACFGCAYLSSTSSNNDVLFERAVNSEFGYELNKKYLPYYDEYSNSSEEKGEYEIYRGESNGTVMIYVNSNILNLYGQMNYEAEYLDTKSKLIYYKYLLNKTKNEDHFMLKATQSTYNIDSLEIDLYQNETDYAAFISNEGRIFIVTLTNVTDILPECFANKCAEQFRLMESTVENGVL